MWDVYREQGRISGDWKLSLIGQNDLDLWHASTKSQRSLSEKVEDIPLLRLTGMKETAGKI